MPNKPLLVINTSPLVALVAALDDFSVIGDVAMLVVPGEVMAELKAGAGRDETARIVEAADNREMNSHPRQPLDEELEVQADTEVSFVKLMPLVGGRNWLELVQPNR